MAKFTGRWPNSSVCEASVSWGSSAELKDLIGPGPFVSSTLLLSPSGFSPTRDSLSLWPLFQQEPGFLSERGKRKQQEL